MHLVVIALRLLDLRRNNLAANMRAEVLAPRNTSDLAILWNDT